MRSTSVELIMKWIEVCLAVIVMNHMINLYGVEAQEPQVPCFFIFGDSLVDNGNNNALFTIARSDYVPYGIDFLDDEIPTGRFCNGKTTVDVITEKLGFDHYIPPVVTVPDNDHQILGGLNYASAAAGIRNESGSLLGDRFSMNIQVSKFIDTVSQMEMILGGRDAAANRINKCLFTLGLGSNDYVNNYLTIPGAFPQTQFYSPETYASVLINQYNQQIKTLHAHGARKVALVGMGPIGCSPSALALPFSDGKTCVERYNSDARMFNDGLKNLVDELNKNYTDSKFIYVNIYGIFEDIMQNAQSLGFMVPNFGCCGVGMNNGAITCLPFEIPCPNRDNYIFWDAFHPTQAMNIIIGTRAYKAQLPSDAYPMDISQLAML